jgi:hypothetical protein
MISNPTGFGLRLGGLRRALGWLAVFGLLTPLMAGATRLSEPDARAVREVVQAQLDAFAADDAERAFSYASPAIRARFGNAHRFMSMVQGSYPMVVRPTAARFFLAQVDRESQGAQPTVTQTVQLQDDAGRLWMATYLLERHKGSGWRISGCVVVADGVNSLT